MLSDSFKWPRSLLLAALVALPSSGAAAVQGVKMMVAAAHPLATAAGLGILQRGGSAVDAAIAVQLVLNVVEPQSSGIGGGAFMLYFDAASNTLNTFDGRETAPAAADEDLFAPEGQRMQWRQAVVGGRSVGVPGVLAMLELAHRKYGRFALGSSIQIGDQHRGQRLCRIATPVGFDRTIRQLWPRSLPYR